MGAFEQLFGPVKGEFEQKKIFPKFKCPGVARGGDVEASIWLVNKLHLQPHLPMETTSYGKAWRAFCKQNLLCVQPLITRQCPLHVHKHGFIEHNRFITLNCWSVVHSDISLHWTSLQRYIVCFARYCCKEEVSLEQYREDCTDISLIYRIHEMFADISAINHERSEQTLFSSIILCISFAQYCRLWHRTDKLPVLT